MNEVTSPVKRPFSVAISSSGFRDLIAKTLTDPKRVARFTASIMSAVSTNPGLKEADPGSILSAAFVGESLQLAMSPQLGHYYIVPYKKKAWGGNPESVTAQFQIGYKGYIQLAIRSGFYKNINVLPIKAGELVHFNPLTEELEINLIQDEAQREAASTSGYYAMFEYLNGFRKSIYWSVEKMQAHANKYSQAFDIEKYLLLQAGKIDKKEEWKYSSFWYKNFDDMAMKTMLRQLLSKWGILSVEMQVAYEKDMGEIMPNGDAAYIDNGAQATEQIPLPTAKGDGTTEAQPAEATGDGISKGELAGLLASIKLAGASPEDAFKAAGCTYTEGAVTRDQYIAVIEWCDQQ